MIKLIEKKPKKEVKTKEIKEPTKIFRNEAELNNSLETYSKLFNEMKEKSKELKEIEKSIKEYMEDKNLQVYEFNDIKINISNKFKITNP
jgi:hypothetical protein